MITGMATLIMVAFNSIVTTPRITVTVTKSRYLGPKRSNNVSIAVLGMAYLSRGRNRGRGLGLVTGSRNSKTGVIVLT